MKIKHILLFYIFILSGSILAQNEQTGIKSQLVDQSGTPIIGAWISINHTGPKVQTDENGYFILNTVTWPAHLDVDLGDENIVHVNVSDTTAALKITANKVVELKEVVIKEKVNRELNTLETRNVETIGKREFQKAACCRLSESFDNSGSVSVSETDAVTGAKEMEILGLRGIYSLMTLDNMPDFSGINYPFALDMIPGTWLNQVAISKGISNAINGSNGFSGQVNIGLKNPFEEPPLFVNVYGNTMGRFEANVHLNKVLKNPAFATGLFVHGSKNFVKTDYNNDNYLDMPLSSQFNVLYKIAMNGLGPWESGLSVHFVKDQREAGQANVDPEHPYVAKSDAQRFAISGNTGFVGFDKEGRTMGFKYQYSNNLLDANYGALNYAGKQTKGYFQALYEDRFDEGNHIIYAGGSLLAEKLEQVISNGDYDRKEFVPGVYAEYSYNPELTADSRFVKRFGLVATIRADFHNLYGTQVAPTLTAKYNLSQDQVVRANIGKGYRTPYFFTDNISSFVNGRQFSIESELEAEEAINYGVSYVLKSKIADRNFTFNGDLYQTSFQNQIIVDQETDLKSVRVSNLEGNSKTTSGLLSSSYDVIDGFNVKVAYKWNHIVFDQQGIEVHKMLVPKHRVLLALHYTTWDENWEFSNTTTWLGNQEYLVRTLENGNAIQERHEAKPYLTTNAQVTRKFKAFDIYVGGENLTNERQKLPIQGMDNPQGSLFDVSQVYAPLMGIRGYVGLRWTLY